MSSGAPQRKHAGREEEEGGEEKAERLAGELFFLCNRQAL